MQALVEVLRSLIGRLSIRSERGASLVEYALLVALVAVTCIIAISFLGGATSSAFQNIGSSINP